MCIKDILVTNSTRVYLAMEWKWLPHNKSLARPIEMDGSLRRRYYFVASYLQTITLYAHLHLIHIIIKILIIFLFYISNLPAPLYTNFCAWILAICSTYIIFSKTYFTPPLKVFRRLGGTWSDIFLKRENILYLI